MSRENVELVATIYPPEPPDMVALVRDDDAFSALSSAVGPLLHPDVEIVWTDRMPDSNLRGAVTGVDGFKARWRELSEAFETVRLLAERFYDLDDDVLVVARLQGRTATGGVDIDFEVAAVWTIEDSRVRRLAEFPTRAEAIESVGISSEELSQREIEELRRA